MKIGRNELCPCGSGQKYKRCCLPLGGQDDAMTCPECGAPGRVTRPLIVTPEELDRLEDIDMRSNFVAYLVREGDLDLAEMAGLDLLNRYPDQVDGLERLAMVYEARGDTAKAIEFYRKALTFATLARGFEPDAIGWYQKQIRQLQAPAPKH